MQFPDMPTESRSKIEAYLDTVKDQISHVELDGYLPVDRVIDAFNKGEEHGKNAFLENLTNGFMTKAVQQFIYSNNILKLLNEKQYLIYSCYISPVEKKTIFVTDEANIVDDEFIKYFYSKASDFEDRFKRDLSERIRFSFMSNENIDEEELEYDNFINILNNG